MPLRRSALYMPGSNPRALAKARHLPADVLILDLEDAVAPADKALARAHVRDAVQAGYGDREVVVRVNAPGTEDGEADLRALAGAAGVDALLLPKVEQAAQLQQLSARLGALGWQDDLRLWAMIETPVGVANVEAIAMADPRLAVLVIGTNDLAKALRVPQTPQREGFQYVLSRCVLAARCAGLDILDGVHIHLDDEAGLVAACAQGRVLGFDGKTLIHPGQLAAANSGFAPDPDAVAAAERMVAAWDAAVNNPGVLVIDGRLVEALHVEEARRTIALARAIAARTAVQS